MQARSAPRRPSAAAFSSSARPLKVPFARLGQADDRVVAHEREPAQVAGAERDRLERAARAVDGAEEARCRSRAARAGRRARAASAASTGRRRRPRSLGTSITTPPSRRRSRQPSATSDRGDGRHVPRPAVLERQAVQVAAVLGGQARHERRPPQRRGSCAVALTVARQENSVLTNTDAAVARRRRRRGRRGRRWCGPRAGRTAGRSRSSTSPGASAFSKRQSWYSESTSTASAPSRPQAHAAVEGALEDRQPPVGLQADEEELAGLVGGEGEARPLGRQERGEVARGRDLEGGRRRRDRPCGRFYVRRPRHG